MGDTVQPTREVFISYAKADKRWADAACAVLEAHRIRCWIAPRDITPGTEWGASIIAGIDGCKIMVLIFSTHANESPQVRREVERVISKGLIVVPCRVEDVTPAGAMEYALCNTHWLDAFTPPVEQQMKLLAESVLALLSRDRGAAQHAPPGKDAGAFRVAGVPPLASDSTGRKKSLDENSSRISGQAFPTAAPVPFTEKAPGVKPQATPASASPVEASRDQFASVWYATPAKFESIGAFSDSGVLDVLPDHFRYRGKKSTIIVSKVIAVSLARQRFSWVPNVLLAMVLVAVTCFFANLGSAGLAACLPLLGGLIFLVWISVNNKWVMVEYRDESGRTRKAYFADGSRNGWGGILGGTIGLYDAIKQHSDAEM